MRHAGPLIALVALAATISFASIQSAVGQQATLAGHAFAVSVDSALGQTLAETPSGVDGSSGPNGFAPIRASQPVVEVPGGVLSIAGAEAATQGDGARAGRPPTVRSEASVDGVDVGLGLLSGGGASSTCFSSADGVGASAVFDSLRIAGGAVLPLSQPPNSEIKVPGVLRAVVNEQIVTPDGRGIVVRGVHLVALELAGKPLLDVVLAESRCLSTPGFGTGGELLPTPQSTGPPSSEASPGAPPVLAPSPTPRPETIPEQTLPEESGAAETAQVPESEPGAPPVRGGLMVTTVEGETSGPPGVLLHVAGDGYEECSEVVIKFQDQQIGTTRPGAGGRIDQSGLSLPGDAMPGPATVSTYCGSEINESARFQVTEDNLHRSAFATSVLQPGQISLKTGELVESLTITAALMLLIAFPFQLFNSTLEENYDEVRSWFALPPRPPSEPGIGQILNFVGFVALGGILYGLISPDFGFNLSSAALALGISVALILISVVFRLPQLYHLRRRHNERAELKVLPGTAVIAAFCVGLSRLLHFLPGYLYGLIAGLSFKRRLSTDTAGRLTSISALSILVLGLFAWFVRVPATHAAASPGAGFWQITAEACLAAIFILGLETMVISLIPLKYLEGPKLTAWRVSVWIAVFGTGLFVFVHLLLQPSSGYVAVTTETSKWTAILLFVSFGLFSVGFWAYFRFRKRVSTTR